MTRPGLVLMIALALFSNAPGLTAHTCCDRAPARTVFMETRSLAPGEYRATFRLALRGAPPDFRQSELSREAAEVGVAARSRSTAFVPPQRLTRGDFPVSGAEKAFSVYFYLDRETADVDFRVVQSGELELEVRGFNLETPDRPPLRLLLVAGRGADVAGWRAFAAKGSANYGLVDGGQHFLAYMVQTLPCGSLADRTKLLAEYINGLHVPDRSLRALGHSMGGLDLRLLVGLANQGQEPYLSAARKLAKVYTAGTPHHGTVLGTVGKGILAGLMRGILCIGEPLMNDVTPEAMASFNERYPWERFTVDGRRVPFLAFSFEARCLPGWARWLARGSDAVVSVESQQWGLPDAAPPDLPWSAAHAPPLDLGSCLPERSYPDVLNWILSDPIAPA